MQTEGAYGGVLTEGRYFYNPLVWDWAISPQFEVPSGKIGIRIALERRRPPARRRSSPSRVRRASSPKVDLPGRYPYNHYAVEFELHDPVIVPAGFRGVVTSALRVGCPRTPTSSSSPTASEGSRSKTLDPGTYYFNPYQTRVSLVDCRSKRFNLGEGSSMDFLSSDGFPGDPRRRRSSSG